MRGDFPFWSSQIFISKVILNVISVSFMAAIIPVLIYKSIPYGWTNLIVTTIISVFSCVITIYFIGCNRSERNRIKSAIKEVKVKIRSKKA